MPPIIDAGRVSELLGKLQGMKPKYEPRTSFADDEDRDAFMAIDVEDPEVYAAQGQMGGSRQQIADSLRNRLRATLTQNRAAREHDIEKATIAPRIAGEYDLRREQIAGQSRERQAQITGDARISQAEAAAAARERQAQEIIEATRGTGRGFSVSGVGSVGPERAASGAAAGRPVTDAMRKRIDAAKKALPTTAVGKWWYGKKPEQEYDAVLAETLHHTGKLPRLQPIVQAAKQNGDRAGVVIRDIEATNGPLDPYEKEYLMRTLGQ
jgi:hypothetical protein